MAAAGAPALLDRALFARFGTASSEAPEAATSQPVPTGDAGDEPAQPVMLGDSGGGGPSTHSLDAWFDDEQEYDGIGVRRGDLHSCSKTERYRVNNISLSLRA